MKQREVTDNENTRWTCVQAFTLSHDEVSKKAAELSETADGKVTVICTPTGGAQTVRLELSENWDHELEDQILVEAIQIARV